MKPIKFEGHNIVFGEGQSEYRDLPALVDRGSVDGKVLQCWELTDDDIMDIVKSKRIWVTQLTFGGSLQPILLETQSPIQQIPEGPRTDPRIPGYDMANNAIMCISNQGLTFCIKYLGSELTAFVDNLFDGCDYRTIRPVDIETYRRMLAAKHNIDKEASIAQAKREYQNQDFKSLKPPICLLFDGDSQFDEIDMLRDWLTGDF